MSDILYINHSKINNDTKKSFSLIETSIVLLVISLLTTGVLLGASLIRTAKAINTIKEINTYRQAINTFYNLHMALPGNFNNAQYELSPSNYTTATTSQIAAADAAIRDTISINGAQNGDVSYKIAGTGVLYYSEAFGVWSHLSNNHLIDGSYSNTCYKITSANRNECLKAGYNLPKITEGYNNTSVYIFYKPDFTVTAMKNMFGLIQDQDKVSESHFLTLTDISRQYVYHIKTSIGNIVAGGGGGIASDLMMKIDNKIDDGMPLTGLVFGINGANSDKYYENPTKEGQCNTYTGSNASFPIANNRNSITYTNNSEKSCLGVILFNEFSN